MDKIYLLIHGSWQGKWVWEKLIRIMEGRGMTCYAIDLPAHGEKENLRKDVRVRHYVDEVVSFIKRKNLQNVILVGHSMAGIVIPKIAEEVPDRISRVVYLAAYVLFDNESISDFASPDFLKLLSDIASKSEDNSTILPTDVVIQRYMNECSPEDIKWVLPRLTPEPFAPVFEKVEMRRYYNLEIPRTYVAATRDRGVTPELSRKFAGKIKCDYYEVDGDHEVMVSRPNELADILCKLD